MMTRCYANTTRPDPAIHSLPGQIIARVQRGHAGSLRLQDRYSHVLDPWSDL